jgi:hypothetical protein
MITLKLTEDQAETLLDELGSLFGYHYSDDQIHAADCGSKVKGIIEAQIAEQKESGSSSE